MAAMADRITTDEVAHIANLARLSLEPAELEEMTGQLAAVLDHAADIEALDVSGVEPTAHPLPLVNVLRDDIVTPGVSRQEVLAMAPAVEDDRFRVPRILGEAP
ncbi:MAG TPA: Asp-tRNA(Asn)/Glu-tRNA(Gln) amidotransferase subunit GatC, partial [Acidimicrobiales bacterium]